MFLKEKLINYKLLITNSAENHKIYHTRSLSILCPRTLDITLAYRLVLAQTEYIDQSMNLSQITERIREHHGCILMAPSSLIVSPLIILFVTIDCTNCAYSSGSPRR